MYVTIAGNLIFNIFRGPLELCLGILMGLAVGVFLWYIPNMSSVSLNALFIFLVIKYS